MALFENNRNNGNQWPREGSVAFNIGDFVQANGLGQVQPVGNTGTIIGISNQMVTSADDDYAVTGAPLNVSEPVYNQELIIGVTGVAATAVMVGTYVDVNLTDPRLVTAGVAGTQILITDFINASTIRGKIIKTA